MPPQMIFLVKPRLIPRAASEAAPKPSHINDVDETSHRIGTGRMLHGGGVDGSLAKLTGLL